MIRSMSSRTRAARRLDREALRSADALLGNETRSPPRETQIDPVPDIASGTGYRAAQKTTASRGGVPRAAHVKGRPGLQKRITLFTRARLIQPRAPAQVEAAIEAAPVSLGRAAIRRIYREKNEAGMFLALDREIAARIAPRGSREATRLRRHVAELEAENQRLRLALRKAGIDPAVVSPGFMW